MQAVVFFDGRHNQISRLADRIAVQTSRRGVNVELRDVSNGSDVEWWRYDAACLVASGCLDDGEPEIVAFVRRHRRNLEQSHAACLWVSSSVDEVEDSGGSPNDGTPPTTRVRMTLRDFIQATGWKPTWLLRVLSAPTYNRYNVLLKLLKKTGPLMTGTPDDDRLDWASVDRFANDIVTEAEHRLCRTRKRAA
jgi:menaquinone-dependent protoporphyrinogen IX oxidase